MANANRRRDREYARWWASLTEERRRELSTFSDSRREDIGWSQQDGRWHRLPIVLEGRLVEPELIEERRWMRRQHLDYLVAHDGIRFFLEKREFHICRRHPPTKALLAEGFVRPSFECPHRGKTCPWRRIATFAGGAAVELVDRGLHELRALRACHPREGAALPSATPSSTSFCEGASRPATPAR